MIISKLKDGLATVILAALTCVGVTALGAEWLNLVAMIVGIAAALVFVYRRL